MFWLALIHLQELPRYERSALPVFVYGVWFSYLCLSDFTVPCLCLASVCSPFVLKRKALLFRCVIYLPLKHFIAATLFVSAQVCFASSSVMSLCCVGLYMLHTCCMLDTQQMVQRFASTLCVWDIWHTNKCMHLTLCIYM